MVDFVQRLRVAFPQQYLLVDIDDGYVDPEVALSFRLCSTSATAAKVTC
jgi:hypothetical protein